MPKLIASAAILTAAILGMSFYLSSSTIHSLLTENHELNKAIKNLTAEAVADITSSGETLRANHLKILSDALVLRSQATLFKARGLKLSDEDRATRTELLKKLGVWN